MVIKGLLYKKGVKDERTRNEDESVEEDWLPMVFFFIWLKLYGCLFV